MRKANVICRQRQRMKHKLFTGAYMMTGSGAAGGAKHDVVNKTLDSIWKQRSGLLASIKRERSLKFTTLLFTQYPMISGFVGYELACDLRHTPILRYATDIMHWANPGPGAKRGLNRLCERPKDVLIRADRAVVLMHSLLDMSGHYLADWMPSLEMRDIEHTLCEYDKYQRVSRDEGLPRSRFIPPHQRNE